MSERDRLKRKGWVFFIVTILCLLGIVGGVIGLLVWLIVLPMESGWNFDLFPSVFFVGVILASWFSLITVARLGQPTFDRLQELTDKAKEMRTDEAE